MARGVRKTAIEKYQEELTETRDFIKQYTQMISKKKEREKELLESIRIEQLSELSTMLDDHDMTIEDVKNMIAESNKK